MLKEIKTKVLPRRMREVHCDTCGRKYFAPRYRLSGYERVENDISIECCGWKMYGKGYDKELKICQVYSH